MSARPCGGIRLRWFYPPSDKGALLWPEPSWALSRVIFWPCLGSPCAFLPAPILAPVGSWAAGQGGGGWMKAPLPLPHFLTQVGVTGVRRPSGQGHLTWGYRSCSCWSPAPGPHMLPPQYWECPHRCGTSFPVAPKLQTWTWSYLLLGRGQTHGKTSWRGPFCSKYGN